ncbi:DUF1631 domain-containing protein [Agarilytica rhodophyticola]|uniref:DUF1631 domain-containing protein n=1 Tax=Agarilytica rhodophyticola TaxID=1737490 RepID=UPI000B343819|nr:DUF1631 domain-containing protein [Agarilytica rhodophyticola]
MPGNAKHDIDAKVVHLEPESHRFVRAQLARLPAPIHSVHEKGKFLVLGLIKSFFDRADDSLFELADKAQSNQEQNLYFDSMREVRVQRRGFEKNFSDAIDQAFANLTSNQPVTNDEDTGRTFNSDALSLVGNDELEEMVALDASIARANKELGEPIQLISLRIDSLVPIKVYQKNNPLSPDVICSAFMAETKKLDIGIKAKLVLFKLFDKSVVGRLGEVYGPINDIFKDNNILPSLSSSSDRRRRRTDNIDRRSAPQQPNNTQATDLGADNSNVSPEVISTLKTLLGDKVAANPAAPSQTQIAANELIQLLSRAQHMPSIMDSRVAINVRSLVNQLQQQTGAQATIGQVDDQVMNLVNLLFDFILEDRNLAPPMKALISRMQIPIIKVAVADKAFFTKGGHVARRLLNEMATAAMGWQGDEETCKRDALYRKIESIVRTLIEEFDTDIRIFSDLLADFSAFLEKEKKRAAVLERRTIDAEDGKAKAEVARTTVAIEIEIRTVGYSLPKVVDHLIKDAWSNVLFVTVLKYGYESEEWLSHLNVLEQLVLSVQPPRTLEQRQKLIKLVPGLLKKLRSGLDTISYNPFEMSDLFKSLERVHIACIRGVPQSGAAAGKPERKPVNPRAAAVSKNAPKAPVNPNKLPPKAKKPAAAADAAIEKEIPERSLNDLAKGVELSEIDSVDRILSDADPKKPIKPVKKAPPVPTSLPLDDPYMVQVRAFVQGAWFDMTDAKGVSTRCRLAAFIKPTGKYIFVNRNGMKVAEKTQFELAMALKNNQLSALDNSVLFDRALETIVSSLRKN